jgi:hypothetical protein
MAGPGLPPALVRPVVAQALERLRVNAPVMAFGDPRFHTGRSRRD